MSFLVTEGTDGYFPFRPNEAQFESMILQLAPSVFPDWTTRLWKKRVYTPDGRGVEADLLMISSDASEWLIVEVELVRHSIAHHIEDQLSRLSNAIYGPHLMPSLGDFGLSDAALTSLTRRPPGFLCIADDHTTELRDCCSSTGFTLAVTRPFYDSRNRPALHCLVPGELRSRRSFGHEFALARFPETLFGRVAYRLPPEFPALRDINLRFAGDTYKVAPARVGDSRILFAPQEIVAYFRFDVLIIAAIDAAAGSFEVLRE